MSYVFVFVFRLLVLQLIIIQMLRGAQLQYYIRSTIILSLIAISLDIGLLTLIIIINLYGYSQSNPSYLCPNVKYYTHKYTNSYQILKVPFIFIILLITVLLSNFIVLIFFSKTIRTNRKKQDQLSKPQLQDKLSIVHEKYIRIMSVLYCVSCFLSVVPVGYYSTLLVQFNRQCSISVDNLYKIILVGLSAFSIISIVICLFLMKKIMNFIQPEEQKSIKSEKSKNQQRYLTQNNHIQKPQNMKQQSIKLNQQSIKQQRQPLLNKSKATQFSKQQKVTKQQRKSISSVSNVLMKSKAGQQNKEQIRKSRFQDEKKPIEQVKEQPLFKQHKQPIIQEVIHKNINDDKKQRQPFLINKNQQRPIHKQQEKIRAKKKQNQKSSFIPKAKSIQTKTQEVQNIKVIKNQERIHEKVVINMNINPNSTQKNKIKKIIQSKEEQLSSDSDDKYYKRRRSPKKNKRNFQKYDDNKDYYDSRQKKEEFAYRQNYYHRSPSRFRGYQQQPKYIFFSPNSIKDLKYFLADEQKKERFNQRHHSHRHFENQHKSNTQKPKYQKPQRPVSPKQQLNKKQNKLILASQINQISVHSPTNAQHPSSSPKKQQQKEVQAEIIKQERQVYKQPQYITTIPHTKNQFKIQNSNIKQSSASFYKQLEIQEDMIKYKSFFENKTPKAPKKDKKKPANMEEYIKNLNQINKNEYFKNELNFLSQKNYSSILSQASNGKIPQQKQDRQRSKMLNLDDKRINKNPLLISQSRKNILLDNIRSKYAQ